MQPNLQETASLVAFTEEILNENFIFVQWNPQSEAYSEP